MEAEDLSERLLGFSGDIVKTCIALNKNPIEKHLSLQLVRSATSSAANYEEVRGAESRSDFLHKMQIVLKELRESAYWIKLLKRIGFGDEAIWNKLWTECDELLRIVGKSVVTAKRKQ